MDTKIRTRAVSLIVYDENVKNLIEVSEQRHCWIYHYKDEAKPHYHIMIKWENPRYLTAICKELKEKYEIESQHIEKIEKIRGYYLYLTHIKEKNKQLYDIKDIHGDPETIEEIKKTYEEEEKNITILDIYDRIENGEITYPELIKWIVYTYKEQTPRYYRTLTDIYKDVYNVKQ